MCPLNKLGTIGAICKLYGQKYVHKYCVFMTLINQNVDLYIHIFATQYLFLNYAADFIDKKTQTQGRSSWL